MGIVATRAETMLANKNDEQLMKTIESDEKFSENV
jgi:hypothetical protein